MNLNQLVDILSKDEYIKKNISLWKKIPPVEAKYAEWPEELSPIILDALKENGIYKGYTHQVSAIKEILKGNDVVVVTPTASGKTLCYNLPVLNALVDDPEARALYLFPTKALSQDQVAVLNDVIKSTGLDIKSNTFDGDTPPAARRKIRQAGSIVVTNPDMLHTGILPQHTGWVRLFENLKYIVIDEVHIYRGVFGSHTANVIRRLLRICRFYGSNPQIICSSATIANPGELAEKLTGRKMTVIDDNGAPSGEKHIIFYNPPVVNKEKGIRRSAVFEARSIAERLIKNGIQTILFARSRVKVEILLKYLQDAVSKGAAGDIQGKAPIVMGYRGGYLPNQRRAIEKGLRNGDIMGVVSTNALELGVDIGALEACVMCGYPGRISSAWQQMGRVGRRENASMAIMVASNSPLDQYVINHPEYFFETSPEHGLINADNLFILMSHLKCAAFELPFEDGEEYGGQDISEILDFFEEKGVLRKLDGRWYWSVSDNFPAYDVSLRSAADDNFIIVDITDPKPNVIGEMDRFGAPMLLHEKAIYMHMGDQYQVEKLDFEEKKAFVRRVDVDYFTDANLQEKHKVLIEERQGANQDVNYGWGEIMVAAMVTIFKKMKLDTHENLGWGHVHLPEIEMHTTAFWISLPKGAENVMKKQEIQGGLVGLGNIIGRIASVHLMCDPNDLRVLCEVRNEHTRLPTLTIYDRYPGGVGFSEKLYSIHPQVLEDCRKAIADCTCISGCPSCTGPEEVTGSFGKASALAILKVLIAGQLDEQKKTEPFVNKSSIRLPFAGKKVGGNG